MRHFLIVSLVGIITLTIVFALYRPDLLEGAWLWIVGLVGPIIGGIKGLYARATAYFKDMNSKTQSS